MKKNIFLFVILGHSVFAQLPNYRVSSLSASQPEEVSITIHPTNPMRLAAGSNLNYYYYSTDGGINWYTGTLTSQYGVWGDPVLRFDADGNLYYSHLSNPPSGVGYWIDRIVVQKSTNGGQSWTTGVGVGYNPPVKNQDKEWLTVDMTQSEYRHHVYMCWTEFDDYGSTSPNDSTRILFSRSTDRGNTWSNPIRVSDTGGDCLDDDNTVEGAVPAVGPNGEIYTSWSGPLGIMFDRSLNGGLTFGQDIFVTHQIGGWALDVPGIYRCNGFPVTACDISDSPYRGRIYILWSDQRNGPDNTDVFLIKSTDGGNTWFGRVRVNNDNTQRHQFFPAMTVDPITGFIYVVFYDRRETTGNVTDVYMAVSRDGGVTFENFKISSSSFIPLGTVFFGDYIDIAAYNRKVHPIWMRMDGNTLSVWTAVYQDTTQITGINESGQRPPFFILHQNYPNPFNPSTMIRFTLPEASKATLHIYNTNGQRVRTLVNQNLNAGYHEVTWDGRNESGGLVASGMYIYRLQAGSYVKSMKMMLMK